MPKQPSIEQQTLRKITTEEKAAAKVEVDRLATEAKTAIDQATDSQGVITAKENGVNAINNVSTDSVAKVDAKRAIDEAANAKKDAIDESALTTEEKAAAKAEVDRLATEAKTAIDQATDTQGVTTAKENGLSAINSVSIVTSANKPTQNVSTKGALPTLGNKAEILNLKGMGFISLGLCGFAWYFGKRKQRETDENAK